MRDTGALLGYLIKLLQPGMPRVVPDQRRKFQHDDLLRKLADDSPVAYSPHRDRPIVERRGLMRQELQEGFLTLSVCNMGLTLRLVFDSTPWAQKPNGQREVTTEEVRVDESGRVHLRSRFILNGVCVLWQGFIDTHSLSGRGRILFDADRAELESQILRDQLMEYHRLHGGYAAGGGSAAAAPEQETATGWAECAAASALLSHRQSSWPYHNLGGVESPPLPPGPPPPTPLQQPHPTYHPLSESPRGGASGSEDTADS